MSEKRITLLTISKILGRQGLIKSYLKLKTKNIMREDDDYTGGCITINTERYYYIDERTASVIYNKRRYRELKF